jgi:2-isopropylmalate synthase
MEKVTVFDTTLRDGEQAPGFSMTVDEKLRFARQLDKLNVDVIEAGFPAASEGDFQAVRAVAREIRGRSVAGLARAVEPDIVRCARALEGADRPRIHVFLPTSDVGLEKALRSSRAEILERTAAAVRRCRDYFDDVEFSAEDATRSNWSFLAEVFSAASEAGAGTLGVTDTFGYAAPEEIYQLIGFLFIHVRQIERVALSAHCHNDLGLAVANSLSALHAGCRQVECTVNGVGERAGNAALEEVVMAIQARPEFYPFESNLTIRELYPASRMLADLTGLPIPPQKPIVGSNVHANGQFAPCDGMIYDRRRSEVMTTETIGYGLN